MPAPYRHQGSNPVRLPFARGLLLFVLPLPMLYGAMSALAVGGTRNALIGLSGFGLLMGAGYAVRRGAHDDAVRKHRRWTARAKLPWKTLAAAMAGIGTVLGAWSLTLHHLFGSVALGVGAGFGVVLTYGADTLSTGRDQGASFGTATDEAVAMLEEAGRKIADIENASRAIRNPELRQRLQRIAEKTHEVLSVLENDPRDLRRARKFLKVYLEGARRVTEGYADTHKLHQDDALEEKFRNVLITIEQTIEEQKAKLVENDVWDLDIQIEVLQDQLRREGI